MRIERHPILDVARGTPFLFTFDGQVLTAYPGETVAAALFAHGIRVFGHHPKDGAPQGIFCANGQCAQCLVIANGRTVKACMTLVRPGMRVEPLDGLPQLPELEHPPAMGPVESVKVPVLIIGGGPAGLSAAIELGQRGVRTLLVDDKHRLGGKLVLQTHRFFGSVEAVYAGTRGVDIARKLEEKVRAYPQVEVWLNSTALAVFSDHKVGILRDGESYVLVEPEVLVVATGARERSLAFPGNTLPGVYGAGAFQTLVNRDLVRPAEKLFIVGGGNVGLIAGYHALQAGIHVVGLCEALPECSGYKVHKDKLMRLGVPIYTSHTVLAAHGREQVESVTIAQVDERFRPIPGTEKTLACDTVLVAVGLDPVDIFYRKAVEFGMKAFVAGDAKEIAEASAAIFSGRIAGFQAAQALGVEKGAVPQEWKELEAVLKSKPGRRVPPPPPPPGTVYPVLHCREEIPCNPCSMVCPQGLITLEGDIRRVPQLRQDKPCLGCERCVVMCPGLAITLVDKRQDPHGPLVTVPLEFSADVFSPGDKVVALDADGNALGEVEVVELREIPRNDRTRLLKLRVPEAWAEKVAGVRLQDPELVRPVDQPVLAAQEPKIICRCERVAEEEIRALIRQGVRDMNEIKAVTRAGMGACGGKTCRNLIKRLFVEEGVPLEDVTDFTERPLFTEVELGVFAGAKLDDHA